MACQTPPTLVQLSIKSLLRDEALMISVLKFLPTKLLPEILKEALADKCTNILRAVVHAWPFPCLPAGTLMKTPCLETLIALLDVLDMVITENIYSRRLEFQVLDLTDMHHAMWSNKTITHEEDSSLHAMMKKQPVEICPKSCVEKPFMLVTDMELLNTSPHQCDKYLFYWFLQRKHSIHLCCRRLFIFTSSVNFTMEFFKNIHLECILQLWLFNLSPEFMKCLFPYLGMMKNLHTLILEEMYQPFSSDASTVQEWISIFLSRLSNFHCLKNLDLNDIYFLTGCLEEWLRHIKMPLETLSITDCRLLQSDLDCLSQCPNICELRHLKLSSVDLSDLCLKSLGVLFERIKGTLQSLELEECEMSDSHFNTILPALSQCSQLTKVNFYHNNISLLTLKKLLLHTDKLRNLTHEMYPAPLECYNKFTILREKFQELCPPLMNILKAQRQLKKVSFAPALVSQSCGSYHLYLLSGGGSLHASRKKNSQ
ncbi:PRAME family member 8-like, partial [Sigmodon hispidus]